MTDSRDEHEPYGFTESPVIARLQADIDHLTAERDEARRMYCKEVEHHHETVWNDGERDFKPFPSLDVAISKGWDCFKDDAA